jgi:N-methylhydantoinase B
VGEALRGLLPAGHFGTIAGIAMAGMDDRVQPPRWTTYQGPNVGGWGALPARDGESALCCVTNGDTRNTPAEIIETKAPLRVHRLALRPDSGGPGEWRGGLGIVYEYEVLTGGPFAMTCALGRTDFPPFGVAGGADGATNLVEVRRADGTLVQLKRTTAFPLARGDRVVVLTGGGGGYGDPARRDPRAAELDHVRGFVSREPPRRASERPAGG